MGTIICLFRMQALRLYDLCQPATDPKSEDGTEKQPKAVEMCRRKVSRNEFRYQLKTYSGDCFDRVSNRIIVFAILSASFSFGFVISTSSSLVVPVIRYPMSHIFTYLVFYSFRLARLCC